MTVNEFGVAGAEALRLLYGDQRRVDVAAIRRSLGETVLAWPGEIDERWWKWLVEVSRGLSYAARVVDASPREVFELLRHGVEVVTLVNVSESSVQRLVVLTQVKRQKFWLCELPGDSAGRWVSQRELAAMLGRSKATAVRRWVVLDPTTDDVAVAPGTAGSEAQHGSGEHKHLSPWARLWEFLRPERADIWIVVIFALFNGLLVLAVPIAIQALVNNVAFGTLLQPLIVLSIILLTCLGFAAGLRFLEQFVVELIQQRLMARVVARLAWQLPRVQLSEAHDFSPELVNRFFDIVTTQKVVAQLLLDGLTVLLTVGLGMFILGFYHPWLLAFDTMLLVLLVINVFVLGRGGVRTSIVESKSKYAIASSLEDIARCQTMFKTGGVAEFALSRLDRLTSDYLVARKAHFRVLMRQIAAGLAIEAFASAVLLGLGGWLVIRGQLTLGQLVAAELIVTLIVTAVAKFAKHLEGFYDLMASMDKLGHLFDLPVEAASGLMHLGHAKAAQLSIRHLNFTHGGGASRLNDVTFDIAAGEVIAVTGPVGCGKSTLLDLLFRLREHTSGRLVLDDLDIGDLRLDVLRQHVALVRDIEIVSGTLVENVHLDRPEISMTDVRAALHRVGLEDDLEDTTRGGVVAGRDQDAWALNTQLSSDGRPLSASQARRLMLARALAGRPRLLLIDGLFDTLPDVDAEELVNELKRSRENCTVLLVTSRMLLAAKCDRVLEL